MLPYLALLGACTALVAGVVYFIHPRQRQRRMRSRQRRMRSRQRKLLYAKHRVLSPSAEGAAMNHRVSMGQPKRVWPWRRGRHDIDVERELQAIIKSTRLHNQSDAAETPPPPSPSED